MKTKAGQGAGIALWTIILYGSWQSIIEASSHQPHGEQRLVLIGMALITVPIAIILIRAAIALFRPSARS